MPGCRAHGVPPNPTPTNYNRNCPWEQAGPRKPGFSRNWCWVSLVPTRSQALPSSRHAQPKPSSQGTPGGVGAAKA